ncbi:glycosyltransferase [Aeoliella sp. ICT_H6.2]|uniref:Glycosyltransferase n=1 Tax=Aeoliella straminimaris TaxID=2954799 RepID=A0A9X2F8G2_9BACT|nr:glycosyltransferase [Aeoliella straminimaris]MCO6043583.1 glycosyltransferase [Aeoliella straminimaris]
MSSEADTVIIVTSFERPNNLRRSLLSLSMQAGLQRLVEIVVADDGSCDHTWSVVESFAKQTGLTTTFTTHPHRGFQPGRSRNEAVLYSCAPYLAFIDGDCVMPPNFLVTHLARRREGVVLCGESARLDPHESDRLTDEVIQRWAEPPNLTSNQRWHLRKKSFRDRLYSMFNVSMRPRMTSNHFSLWRSDFELVNGFDLNYLGWGLEDCDLQRRLQKAGIRCRSVLSETKGYHLWHPRDESFVPDAKNTANERYFNQQKNAGCYASDGLQQLVGGDTAYWHWQDGTLADSSELHGPNSQAA